MANFLVPLLQAELQNGLLKQETVRMQESKRLHSFYESCPVSVSAPVQSFCEKAHTEKELEREPSEGTSLSPSLLPSHL